MEVSNKIRN